MEPQTFLSFPAILTFFLFIFPASMLLRKSKTRSRKSLNLPPGPWKLPLIGNMHQLVCSLPHHRLRQLAKRYGPLMQLQLGEVTTIVISSPEIAKQMMKTHDINFSQRPFMLAINVVTYAGADIGCAPYGDYWKQLRKLCILELLNAKRVQSFRLIREEEVSGLISSVLTCAGSVVNLSSLLFSLSFSITARAAFGKKHTDQEAFIPAIQEVIKLSGGFCVADLFPSLPLLHVFSGMLPRLKNLHRKIDIAMENIIDEHKACRAKAKNNAGDGEADDLVDVLLNLQDHGNLEFPLTTTNIKAVMVDVFIGGSETSSTTVEWAMSELLKNPRAMEKAQVEVREVFDKMGEVDETGLEELKYLKLVVKETLRLHPPAPLLVPRECRQQCEINGYDIPVKTKLLVNAWALGRDPDYWNEPEKFYPERFLESSVDYKGTDFEYLPFGAGRRMCPGILFAIANIELPLAQLLYYFDWKLPNGTKNEELDMTEEFGGAVRRQKDLYLIPVPYKPLPVD